MSVINRNVTRTIKNTTESTLETKSISSDELAFNLQTTDEFFIGFKKPFTTRYFHFATANTEAATVSLEYWDGSDWSDVEDLVDQTQGFQQSGFLSWQNPGDWVALKQDPVSDRELFWVKLTVSANLSAGTSLQALLNLFCDNDLVSKYYPEIISDDRYLPEGKSDFIEQYEAAKDLVVLRLKQSKIIEDESQIIDINEVAVASVHAFAWILLNPIANSEEQEDRAKKARDNFNSELNEVRLDLDLDDSGVIETDEEEIGHIVIPRM